MTYSWRVGVIGYGFSAKIFHIPFIQAAPEFTLQAIVQRSPKAGDDASVDHPGATPYRTAEELVQDANVELVVVTTAPDSHYRLTKLALEAGKHVLCEKPFTPTAKEAHELVTLAQKHKRVLSIFQNRRWDADFLTVSDLIQKGTLGRIVEFESHFDRYEPQQPANAATWKHVVMPGHGAIYDVGVHLLDQSVRLFGLPDRVTGIIGTQREGSEIGFEDAFTVLLHYSGLLVTVKATVISPAAKQLRFWVRGERGSFKKYHLDIQEDQLLAGMRPGDRGFAQEPPERFGTLVTIQNGQFVEQTVPTVDPPTYSTYYRRLAQALEGHSEAPATGSDAANVIRIIELARESSELGKTMVFS